MFSQSTPLFYHKCIFISELAKKGKRNELIELEYENCLGEFVGVYNAIMLLAKDQFSKAVELLIDSFKANLNHAVQGYAWGGHEVEVEDLLKRGASLKYALRGFAYGNYHEKVEEILQHNPKLINSALKGYAQGGYIEQVDALLQRGGSNEAALKGYAQAGFIDLVNQCLNEELAALAIKGYAKAGFINEMNNVINQYHHKMMYCSYLDYFSNRNRVREDEYYNKSLQQAAIQGYASGGHVKQVENALANNSGLTEYALFGYAYNGHIKEVNTLLKKGKCQRAEMDSTLHYRCSDGYVKGNIFSPENQTRLLSYTDDKKLRVCLDTYVCREIKYKNLPPLMNPNFGLYDIEHEKLNHIMNNYRVNLTQAGALNKLGKGGKLWLFIGPDILEKAGLPFEIFLIITSFIIDMNGFQPTDLHIIFHAINEKTCAARLEKNNIAFQAGLPFSLFYKNILNIQQSYEAVNQKYNQRFKVLL